MSCIQGENYEKIHCKYDCYSKCVIAGIITYIYKR